VLCEVCMIVRGAADTAVTVLSCQRDCACVALSAEGEARRPGERTKGLQVLLCMCQEAACCCHLCLPLAAVSRQLQEGSYGPNTEGVPRLSRWLLCCCCCHCAVYVCVGWQDEEMMTAAGGRT
jgi:hypothetical protein